MILCSLRLAFFLCHPHWHQHMFFHPKKGVRLLIQFMVQFSPRALFNMQTKMSMERATASTIKTVTVKTKRACTIHICILPTHPRICLDNCLKGRCIMRLCIYLSFAITILIFPSSPLDLFLARAISGTKGEHDMTCLL